jgi:GNAT superfamily N-acetyltransferase
MNPEDHITAIRQAAKSDAPEIARLLTLLGHPTAESDVTERWKEWSAQGNIVLVAVSPDGMLVGMATLHRMFVLHRPRPVGRISTLVVHERVRGHGIGRALVAAAERLLTKSGCGILEVTSNTKREDAHAFYMHLDYEHTSMRFAKVLNALN